MEKTQIWGASVSVQFRWIYKIYNILAGESQPHQVPLMKANNKHE